MRPRTTGISAQQIPAQTFKPKSEWKHEEEASFLFVYLPGFAMDQLTITPDNSKRTVNIEGRRRLPSNRLLSVNETFNIPEDCELPKMDKQFVRGILMLKMPRNIVIPQLVPQQQTVKETKEEASKPQEPIGDSMAIKDEEQTDPAAKETSTTGFEKQSPDDKAAIDKKSVMTAAKSDEEKWVEKKEENDDGSGKPAKADESHENLVQNAGVKEEESKEQSKESAMAVAKAEEKEKKPKSGDESADAKGKEAGKEVVKASSKKGMVKEVNGDRKLIVNMGAAALIIMGFGVSLFYTIAH